MSDTNARDGPRDILARWQDRLVTVTGVLDRLYSHTGRGRPRLVALLQDGEVLLPDGSRHYLGHLHLRDASALCGFSLGQRLRCRCGIRPYWKQPKTGGEPWRTWSLAYPRDAQALPALPRLVLPHPRAHSAPADPAPGPMFRPD
jgi:hypothetical protein